MDISRLISLANKDIYLTIHFLIVLKIKELLIKIKQSHCFILALGKVYTLIRRSSKLRSTKIIVFNEELIPQTCNLSKSGIRIGNDDRLLCGLRRRAATATATLWLDCRPLLRMLLLGEINEDLLQSGLTDAVVQNVQYRSAPLQLSKDIRPA